MPQKIILDTDIGYGTDADDAIALAYLLRRQDCEILGITTVGRHSEWRAELAEVICTQMGRGGIPIAAGANHPLYANTYWPLNPVHKWPAETGTPPLRTYIPNQAATLLAKVIRGNPGEITLITIGQFTNLAMLLLVDPAAVDMLKAVVSMGGRISAPGEPPIAECNVILDPVAAGIAFQRLGEQLTLLPLDPICGKGLTSEELTVMLADESLAAVRDCCHAWQSFRGASGVGLADPLTCAMAFEPDLVELDHGTIRLKLYDHEIPDGAAFANDAVTGATFFDRDTTGPHHVVRTAHSKATHRHLSQVFGTAVLP